MTRQWYLGLLVVVGLVVLALAASVWLPWTERPVHASTDWRKQYEEWLGNDMKCPRDNDRAQTPSGAWLPYNSCQCVSYTAFRLSRAGVKSEDWRGLGSAGNWVTNAELKKKQGANISTGKKCQKGAVYQNGDHVMWTEECHSDGRVDVTEYNYYGNPNRPDCVAGGYCSRTLNNKEASIGTYIYFSNVNTSNGGNSNGGNSGAPSKPQELKVGDIQRNKAKISWKKQSGVNYFCLNWSDKDVTPNGCDQRVKGESSFKPSNLKANKDYIVWLQACTKDNVCSSPVKTRFKTKR